MSCPECGHGNMLNGKIIHAYRCSQANTFTAQAMPSQDIAGLVERLENMHSGVWPTLKSEAAAAALRTLAAENERLIPWADKLKGWKHFVVCNAGSQTPLGSDMCICVRGIQEELEHYRARIASLEAEIEAGRKWITVSQPPPFRKEVLGWHQGNYDYDGDSPVMVLWLREDGEWIDDSQDSGTFPSSHSITHWMPLPEPPKAIDAALKQMGEGK